MACVAEGWCHTCQELRQLPLQSLDFLDKQLQEAISQAFPGSGRGAVHSNSRWVLVYVEPKKWQVWKKKRLLIFQAVGDGYTLARENHDFTI